MFFKISGPVWDIETIAKGKSIRERQRLRKCTAVRVGESSGETLAFNSRMVRYVMLSFIGTKRTASAEKKSKSSEFFVFNETK
jgi:hypothetical protein